MKYLNTTLILLMVMAFSACGGGDPSAKLTAHSWKMDIDALVAQMPKERKSSLSDKMLEKMKESVNKARFIFEKDGVLKMITPTGKEEQGTWKLSADGKTFTTTEGDGKKEVVNTITSLSSSKLAFEYKSRGETVKMVLVPAK